MDLGAFLAAPGIVQIHAVTALLALLVGSVQFAGLKGTGIHRTLGYVWVAAMVITASSSFLIKEIVPGSFSPIHLLSVLTLVCLPYAVYAALCHRVRGHRLTMMGLFFSGLLVAGAFTLLPGSLMHQVVFVG